MLVLNSPLALGLPAGGMSSRPQADALLSLPLPFSPPLSLPLPRDRKGPPRTSTCSTRPCPTWSCGRATAQSPLWPSRVRVPTLPSSPSPLWPVVTLTPFPLGFSGALRAEPPRLLCAPNWTRDQPQGWPGGAVQAEAEGGHSRRQPRSLAGPASPGHRTQYPGPFPPDEIPQSLMSTAKASNPDGAFLEEPQRRWPWQRLLKPRGLAGTRLQPEVLPGACGQGRGAGPQTAPAPSALPLLQSECQQGRWLQVTGSVLPLGWHWNPQRIKSKIQTPVSVLLPASLMADLSPGKPGQDLFLGRP